MTKDCLSCYKNSLFYFQKPFTSDIFDICVQTHAFLNIICILDFPKRTGSAAQNFNYRSFHRKCANRVGSESKSTFDCVAQTTYKLLLVGGFNSTIIVECCSRKLLYTLPTWAFCTVICILQAYLAIFRISSHLYHHMGKGISYIRTAKECC